MDMYQPFIEGEKFYLRAILKEDLTGNMIKWPNDPEVTQYMVMGCVPGSGSIYCSWDSPEEEYEKLRKSKHDVVFAIIDKKSNKMIGNAGLYEINWLARHAELRIVIGEKQYWGKGIGTDIVRALVKYGFDNLNLNKVHLGCNADDKRANKCYKKAGFVYEGTIRDYHFRNGRYYNANLYSILREEFHGKNKKLGDRNV